jgi:hypothetical protein
MKKGKESLTPVKNRFKNPLMKKSKKKIIGFYR